MPSQWNNVQNRAYLVLRRLFDLFFDLLYKLAFGSKGESVPPITDLLLLEPAVSLALKIRTGKLKSTDLVKAYISRIEEVNPYINAVIDKRYEHALKEAGEVDKLIESKTKPQDELEREKPFLGIPVSVKNSVGVKGLLQDAGMTLRKDMRAEKDSDVVQLLRNSGAIPLVATNVPELCMWVESYNNIHGRTNNPYDIKRNAGGSSGGEGSLLGSAGSVIGVGTDIGGSIRIPAFYNGVFGHKPTSGVVSNSGQYPNFAGNFSIYKCTGPMCRYAIDLLPMLKVMAGSNISLLKLDEKVDFKKVKIFYMEDDSGILNKARTTLEMRNSVKNAVNHFFHTYGIKAQKVNLNKLAYGFKMWQAKLILSDAVPYCQQFKCNKGRMNPFTELFKWFLWSSSHTLPAIILALSEQLAPAKDSEEITSFSLMCDDLSKELEELLGNNGIFLFPSLCEPALYHFQSVTRVESFSYTSVFNVLSVPVTQCPIGLSVKGLPLGIQIVCSKYNDHLCIAAASELERSFGGWHSPTAIL